MKRVIKYSLELNILNFTEISFELHFRFSILQIAIVFGTITGQLRTGNWQVENSVIFAISIFIIFLFLTEPRMIEEHHKTKP